MTCWKPRFLFLVYQLRDISVLRWEWFFTKEQATSQGLPIPASYRSTHYKSKDKLQMGGLVEGSLFYSIANLIGGLFAKPLLCCRTLLQGTMLPKTGNGTHMIEHDPLTCSIPWLHRQLCSAEVGKGKSGERGGRTSKAFAGAMDKTAIGPSWSLSQVSFPITESFYWWHVSRQQIPQLKRWKPSWLSKSLLSARHIGAHWSPV